MLYTLKNSVKRWRLTSRLILKSFFSYFFWRSCEYNATMNEMWIKIKKNDFIYIYMPISHFLHRSFTLLIFCLSLLMNMHTTYFMGFKTISTWKYLKKRWGTSRKQAPSKSKIHIFKIPGISMTSIWHLPLISWSKRISI